MTRPAGTPNKNKQALIKLLQEKYPGYEPVLEIARSAHELRAMAEQAEGEEAAALWRDAGNMHEKVAQYVTPKLKAVEVSGSEGGDLTVQIVRHKRLTVVGLEPEGVEKGEAYARKDEE